jgi:hypothetical protein
MDIGDTMSRYEQFKHWAIEGYRDFHFDLAQEVKTTVLTLTAWKAVDIPIDFVDWVMIGVVVDNQIRVFTHDNRISLYRPDADQDGVTDPITTTVDPTVQEGVPFWFWNNRTSQGEDAGQLYGLTTKYNGVGYFKFNKERGEIQFDPSVDGSTVIYLEYISDGIDPCEKTMVNLYAAKLIKMYIHWCRLRFSKSANQAQIQRAQDDYWKEHFKVQNRIQKITVDDVLAAARDAYRLVQST